ncbi:MAG: hypothetical protein Q9210_002729 [Variospora velana]
MSYFYVLDYDEDEVEEARTKLEVNAQMYGIVALKAVARVKFNHSCNKIIFGGGCGNRKINNTTTGTVSIELLRGPPTNVVPIKCLIENLSNTGSFAWTPSLGLEADVSRYGLRIVDTATGQYQYSTQFGISNDAVHPPSSSSSVAPTTSQAASQATEGQVQVPTTSAEQTVATSIAAVANITTTSSAIVQSTAVANSLVVIATTHVPIPLPVSSGSGIPQTMTVLQPSKNMTVPASLQTSKTAGPTRVTASASASFVSSSLSGTGSPIAEATGPSAPSSGARKAFAGSLLAGLGAMAAFVL